MKFSIITPTYNRADTIERAIESILNQNYHNFEMIIVDDGSNDNTDNIVEKYFNDERIRYIGPNKNGGVNVARNIGLKNVSTDSEWITFLDSDDEFFPDALEKMKNVIENNTDYDYFRFSVVYDNGEPACLAQNDNIVLDYTDTLKQEKVSGEWVVTFSQKVLENGFLFEESVNAFESISWYELSKYELCFHSLEKVRIYQLDVEGLQRQSNKTNQYYMNQSNGIKLFLNRHGEALKKYNKKDAAVKLYMLVNASFRIGNYRDTIKYLAKAIMLDPFNSNVIKKIFRRN